MMIPADSSCENDGFPDDVRVAIDSADAESGGGEWTFRDEYAEEDGPPFS